MDIQRKKRVTIQGVAGCYHDAAARGYFGNEQIDTLPCDSFVEMFDALAADASLIGILAIENTIAGALLQNHELLRKSDMCIVGEYKMRISHVLAALPGQTIDELTEVNSHREQPYGPCGRLRRIRRRSLRPQRARTLH